MNGQDIALATAALTVLAALIKGVWNASKTLTTISNEIKAIRHLLGEGSERLDEHQEILGQFEQLLDEHDEVLDDHEERLGYLEKNHLGE